MVFTYCKTLAIMSMPVAASRCTDGNIPHGNSLYILFPMGITLFTCAHRPVLFIDLLWGKTKIGVRNVHNL